MIWELDIVGRSNYEVLRIFAEWWTGGRREQLHYTSTAQRV